VKKFGSLSRPLRIERMMFHHLLGAVGIMFVEPGAEQRRDLEGQADRKA